MYKWCVFLHLVRKSPILLTTRSAFFIQKSHSSYFTFKPNILFYIFESVFCFIFIFYIINLLIAAGIGKGIQSAKRFCYDIITEPIVAKQVPNMNYLQTLMVYVNKKLNDGYQLYNSVFVSKSVQKYAPLQEQLVYLVNSMAVNQLIQTAISYIR